MSRLVGTKRSSGDSRRIERKSEAIPSQRFGVYDPGEGAEAVHLLDRRSDRAISYTPCYMMFRSHFHFGTNSGQMVWL